MSEWDKSKPLIGDKKNLFPAVAQANWAALDNLLANYRQALRLTYNSATTITVSAGECTVSNSGGTIRYFRKNSSSSDLTSADLDTGSFSVSTTYYVYAVGDVSQAAAQFKISLSSTSPTGFSYYKRLGRFTLDSSSNITTIIDDVYGGIGAPVSKSFETTYQATVDGDVVGNTDLVQATHGFTAYTDSSSSPTTVIQKAYGPWVSGATGLQWPISFPVKKGDYYKVTNVGSSGGTLKFIPRGV